MKATQYLENYKEGYPNDGDDLAPLSKKELNEKLGKKGLFSTNSAIAIGRYNSGLKAVEEQSGKNDPSTAVCNLYIHNGHLAIHFSLKDSGVLRFGIKRHFITRIAVISNFEILSEKETSGLGGAIIGDLLMGSFGRKVGRELGKSIKTKVSSKERINILAIHTLVERKKNVITILFKYQDLPSINRFLYRNFEKKIIQVSPSDQQEND